MRGLVLPSFVIGRGQHGSGGGLPAGDGGDQDDQPVLVLAAPVSDLVLDDPDIPGQGRVEILPAAGGGNQRLAAAALDRCLDQDRPVGAVGQQFQERQPGAGFHPPQQVGAGIGGCAPVGPSVEQPVRQQQPAFLQPRVEFPGQGLLAAALGHRRAHRRQHRRARPALADRDQPDLRVRAVPGPRPERRPVRLGVRCLQLGPVNGHQPPRAEERAVRLQPGDGLRDLREQLRHRLGAEALPGLGDRALRGRLPPPVPRPPRPQRPGQPLGDLLIVLIAEQRQRHDQVNHHMRRQLAAPPASTLPGRLHRIIDSVTGHPRRQNTKRHQVRQHQPGHPASLRHDQRSVA